jgi:hypothetical protein
MKTTFTHIKLISVLLSVLIFFSSTGLTVRAHYCASEQILMKSIFNNNLSCKHDESRQTSCAEKNVVKDCCQKKIKSAKQHHDCCTDFSHYYKMNVDADVSNLKTASNDFFILPENSAIIIHILPSIDLPVIIRECEQRAPLLSGIQLLTSIHQLKIDTNCTNV